MRAGDHARVEGALLAHDRIHHTALDRRPDLLVVGHSEIRKRVTGERQAATQRDLADEQRRPRIIVACRDRGERCQPRHIVGFIGDVGPQAGHHVALVDGVKNLEHVRHFQRPSLGRRRTQIAQRHVVEMQRRARQLTVIGGRVAGRRLVIGASVLGAAERLRGAALPIIRARQCDRVDDAVGDAGEMRKG